MKLHFDNDARVLKSKNDLDLTYFQFVHKFLVSYDYFLKS